MKDSRLWAWMGGLLLMAASQISQATTLLSDPAWQQGRLNNGFSWQLLTTPQRPNDNIEIRLLVNTGSMVEGTHQIGYSQLVSRLAMVHNNALTPQQQRHLWSKAMESGSALAPVTTSYGYTLYSLSLNDSRPELIKEALLWLFSTAGKMTISEDIINTALRAKYRIATWPVSTQDPLWRYRLQGSMLLGHDPSAQPQPPIDIAQLQDFYQRWYTPDAMTLFVVGNLDGRIVTEQINKIFSPLSGKRAAPSPIPTLPPLSHQPMNFIHTQQRDQLLLVWDSPEQMVRDSQNLEHYWRLDLAREALFRHLQEKLAVASEERPANSVKFGCERLFQRIQCRVQVDTSEAAVRDTLQMLATILQQLKDKGLPEQEYDALMSEKRHHLEKLYVTYARTDTHILMEKRLSSHLNGVVDIAPEQYRTLRQEFLTRLSPALLNQALLQQLNQEPTIMLTQPEGEQEINTKELHQEWQRIFPSHTH